MRRPLKVGVLVDLARGPAAGGHVRTWERLAQAAAGLGDPRFDLTVHFAGPDRREIGLGPGVRLLTLPPAFSTERLPFLAHVPDHTDLAPWHGALASHIHSYDLVHTTDAFFAASRTADMVARRRGIPLTTSVHTNTPEYARLYTARTVEHALGRLGKRLLVGGLGVDRRVETSMRRRLDAHMRRAAFVWVSRPEALPHAMAASGGKAALLRRGIDLRTFSPERRRPDAFAALGVPAGALVALYVGRISPGKNVDLLAAAAERLAATPLHFVLVGAGDEREALRRRLGPLATLTGPLDEAALAPLYASADLFVFPSEIEEHANVVVEALASGLPVLVAAKGGMGRVVRAGETGLVLPSADPGLWAEAVAALAADPDRRHAMGTAARRFAETAIPTWQAILEEDLLPGWLAIAGGA